MATINKKSVWNTVKLFFLLSFTYVMMDLFMAQFYNRCFEASPESAYRVESNIYSHDLIPNIRARAQWGFEKYKIYTNSLGFRDKHIRDLDLISNTYRIVFIGDSFAEGVGVDYADSFVGQIDDHFKQKDIEVLNAGVLSYSTCIYYSKINEFIRKGFEFDELVVFIDVPDIHADALFYDVDDQGIIIKTPVYEEYLSRHTSKNKVAASHYSITVKFIELMHEMRNVKPKSALNDTGSKWTINSKLFEAFGKKGLTKSKRHMDNLLKLLRLHGISLTIVVYPWPDQIFYRDINSIHVSFWEKWAHKNEVQFINLFPPFFKNKNEMASIKKYYYFGDVHWNKQGHSLVAKSFLDSFRYKRNQEF